MILQTRTTHAFIEIIPVSLETTLYRSHPEEVRQAISNLFNVIEELSLYDSDKSLSELVELREEGKL